MGEYRHQLACGAVVVVTLTADRRHCLHDARRCPDVELLARAIAGELGDVDRNGHERPAPTPDGESADESGA